MGVSGFEPPTSSMSRRYPNRTRSHSRLTSTNRVLLYKSSVGKPKVFLFTGKQVEPMEALHCEDCGEVVTKNDGVYSCDCQTYEDPNDEVEYIPEKVTSWDYISYDG